MQKLENRLRFDGVTDSLKVGTFLRHSVVRGTCSSGCSADRNIAVDSLMPFDSSECRYARREVEGILYVRTATLNSIV